jgi:hypothetical protein
MIEAVEGQRNHVRGSGSRRALRDSTVIRIQETHLGKTGPVRQPFIGPGIGDIQELAVEAAVFAVFQIAASDP